MTDLEAIAARDWPEDYQQENGRYENRCAICKKQFIGHKRRFCCKLCARAAAEYLREKE